MGRCGAWALGASLCLHAPGRFVLLRRLLRTSVGFKGYSVGGRLITRSES